VCRQLVVVLFVGGEVVEDDMDFPIGRLLGDQVGHKGLEIDAFLVCVVFPRITPVATSSAAKRLTVPCRL